jgi:hypothetical protein
MMVTNSIQTQLKEALNLNLAIKKEVQNHKIQMFMNPKAQHKDIDHIQSFKEINV